MRSETDIKEWLKENFADQVTFDEPMSSHTTFKVGGTAEMFVCPSNHDNAVKIINKANQTHTPVFAVGKGSNLIVKDSGIGGIVISFEKIEEAITAEEVENNRVILNTHAGTRLNAVCRFAIRNGFSGLNFALGIPGSVGGSISMNAGTATGEMKDVVQSVDILNGSGELKTVEKEALDFSYRKLSWGASSPAPIIFNASFLLTKDDKELLKKEADMLLKKRNESQPVSLPNAGCIFKNPDSDNPAGKLVDLSGLKGKSIGNAQISEKHGNFIVNKGGATASDVISLIDLARETVFNKFNIRLESEVQIVG